MSVEVTFEMVDILLCTGGNIYVRCPENDADAVMILFRERIRKFCILCIYRVSIYMYIYVFAPYGDYYLFMYLCPTKCSVHIWSCNMVYMDYRLYEEGHHLPARLKA